MVKCPKKENNTNIVAFVIWENIESIHHVLREATTVERWAFFIKKGCHKCLPPHLHTNKACLSNFARGFEKVVERRDKGDSMCCPLATLC
jgi:hypothetical protein